MEETMKGMESCLFGATDAVCAAIAKLDAKGFGRRLWEKDAAVWKDEPQHVKIIKNSLGWLDSPGKMVDRTTELAEFLSEIKKSGFSRVVHMGMGGSSLAPLAFAQAFGTGDGGLPVTVLDTTDPATVLAVEQAGDVMKTLFIEASKSGSTVESRSFGEYFYGKTGGANCAVVTDPGSMLETLARERNYRRIFLNFSDIGGRYSALSYFGLLPAALMGVDVSLLLARAMDMAGRCGPEIPVAENPAVCLGAAMGEFALRGRNKLTLVLPESVSTFGAWLEQLIAESTGKEGKGILPVAGEAVGAPSDYGDDRFFVYVKIASEPDAAPDASIEALKQAGMPVATLTLKDRYDLGGEFLRWEIATAAAGALLGIDPFDQPNVQESKDLTNRILKQVAEEGKLPESAPDVSADGLEIYGTPGAPNIADALAGFFRQAKSGDYLSILAYITEGDAVEASLRNIRLLARKRLRIAGTHGYGPRYLHSTGQLHKGGPNTGLFVLLTADDAQDAAIPGKPFGFGTLRKAQALGDMEALRGHGRRVLRIHLGKNIEHGLATLEKSLASALS